MRFPEISIKIIPIKEQPFTTLGHWFEKEDNSFCILLTEMKDWRYVALVFIHEFTELFICWKEGITTDMADNFDSLWESELKKGLHKIEQEAGFDKRCPYRKGHVWGVRMERLFSWLLGVKWSKYVSYCNELMKEYQ